MLINSLLIFIEETLPICILYAYLCAWHATLAPANMHIKDDKNQNSLLGKTQFGLALSIPIAISKVGKQLFMRLSAERAPQQQHVYYFFAIMLGLICSVFFTQLRPSLGMAFEGLGYEVALIALSIMCVTCVLVAMRTPIPIVSKLLFSVGLFFLVVPHASDFIVFLSSVAQAQLHSIVYVGMSIGFGICISISYLLFVAFLNIKKSYALKLAISLFLAGQLSGIVNTLQQIDILSSTLPLWNSNDFIADRNEYGQFFHVLFGYDATPSSIYLLVLATFSVLIFTFLMSITPHKDNVHGAIQ